MAFYIKKVFFMQFKIENTFLMQHKIKNGILMEVDDVEAIKARDIEKILKREENYGMQLPEFKKLKEEGLNLDFCAEPVAEKKKGKTSQSEKAEKFEIYTHIGEVGGSRKHKVKLISQKLQTRQVTLANVFKILKEVGVDEFKVVINAHKKPGEGEEKPEKSEEIS